MIKLEWPIGLDGEIQRQLEAMRELVIGKDFDDKAVESLARELSSSIRQAGFPIARVLVRVDDAARLRQTGTLMLTVFEGRVGDIQIQNSSAVETNRLLRRAKAALCPDGFEGGCVLRSARLERATQLIQDLPGVKLASTQMSAEGVAVGHTRITLETVPSGPKVTGLVSADNYGLASTGRNRFFVAASVNNLFGAGDVFDVLLGTTSQHQGTGRLGFSAPVGDNGWRATASLSRSNYSVPNANLNIRGTADTATLGASYPITRGLDRNATVAIDGVAVRSKTELPDFGVLISDKRLSAVKLSLIGDSGDRAQQFGLSSTSYNLSVLAGKVSNNSAQADPADVLGRYLKLAWFAQRQHNLEATGHWYVAGNVRGQFASRNLDAYEKLPLGGAFGVRGYAAEEGSLDDGLLATAELRYRLQATPTIQLAPGGFVDYGSGRVNHQRFDGWQAFNGYPDGASNHRSLASYGLGVDTKIDTWGVFSAMWARRFGWSDESINHPGSASGRFWLTASVRY